MNNSKLKCDAANWCTIKVIGFVKAPYLFIEIGFSPTNSYKWIDLDGNYDNEKFSLKNIKIYKLLNEQ